MNYIFLLLEICKIPEIIGALVAIIVKEYFKAIISVKLGDPLPKINDTITLNPKKNIDLIGFILMVIFGYGWNKPIETTSLYYKNRKLGTIITHLLPLVINMLIGLLIVILIKGIYCINILKINNNFSQILLFICLILSKIAIMNFRLAIVNLIPIYPFEGNKILKLFLTPNFTIKFISIEKFLLIIYVIFLSTGSLGHTIDFLINKITFNFVDFLKF